MSDQPKPIRIDAAEVAEAVRRLSPACYLAELHDDWISIGIVRDGEIKGVSRLSLRLSDHSQSIDEFTDRNIAPLVAMLTAEHPPA